MTKAQEKVIDMIKETACEYKPVKGVDVEDLGETYKYTDIVSVAVWFKCESALDRSMAHIFIGPRGGVSYPVQTGKQQIRKRFNWDYDKVISDQEKGWRKYNLVNFGRE